MLTLKDLQQLDTASCSLEKHKQICNQAVLELFEYKKIEDICEKLSTQVTYVKLPSFNEVVARFYNDNNDILYNFKRQRFEIVSNDTGTFVTTLDLRNFGVTWAFTKEELE